MPKYKKCVLCADDIFLYKKLKTSSVGLEILLSSYLPQSPELVDCISFSTNGFDGKSTILKKLIVSFNRIKMGGTVVIITSKTTGQSFLKKVMKELQIPVEITNKEGQYHILSVIKTFIEPLDLENLYYKFMLKDDIILHERIRDIDFTFHSTQQLFSKERIDRGSLFLLNTIQLNEQDRLLDYGCGYGILGIAAAKIFNLSDVSFIDIKSLAYDKTCQNIKENQLTCKTNVFLATDLSHYNRSFDIILSHFPIHVSNIQKLEMLQNCLNALDKCGKIICVIPSTFDFRKLAMDIFQNYQVIGEDIKAGYYVFVSIKK